MNPVAFKDDEVRQQFWRMSFRNPRHFYLVSGAAVMAYGISGRPLVLTSIYRPDDKGSVHSLWRGTDCRIYHAARDVPELWSGLHDDEAEELAESLNRAFEYRRGDDSLSRVAIIHGEGLNRHLHLQTPRFDQWRA